MPKKPNLYVAEAIVSHLASNKWPSQEDAAHLFCAPEIPQMRKLVLDYPDLPSALFAVAANETGSRAAFSLALLRHVAGEPKWTHPLQSLFLKKCDANPAFACHVIWRLLDNPELPPEWHERLFRYIFDNWDAWKQHNAEFEEPGPLENATVVENRLNDHTFPSSKKWIYLLCLPDGLTADASAAKRIVEREINSSDQFRAHVAKAIAERFWR